MTTISYDVSLRTVVTVDKNAVINKTAWDCIEQIVCKLKEATDDEIIFIYDWDIETHE